MDETISEFLASDHRRLDKLFAESLGARNEDRLDRFDEFREGLLRHIGIDEKILFPALKHLKEKTIEELLQTLHADHAVISALLVLSPSDRNAKRIETLLAPHNRLEEGPNGLYELCDRLPPSTRDRVLKEAKAYPKVKIKPCNDTEIAARNADKMFDDVLKTRKEKNHT